jgi:hypothetical protein
MDMQYHRNFDARNYDELLLICKIRCRPTCREEKYPPATHMQAQATCGGVATSTHASFLFSLINHRPSNKIPHNLERINLSKNTGRSSIAIMSLSSKLSITDVDLSGKRVLIRVSSLRIGGIRS